MKKMPDNPPEIGLQMHEAALLARKGQPDEAIGALDKILRVHPEEAHIWNIRGIICRDLGRLDEALVSFDTALAIDPDCAPALANKGRVLWAIGYLPEALDYIDRAITVAPDEYAIWMHRGEIAARLGDRLKAAESYGAMVLMNPTDAELWATWGHELFAAGRIKLAEGALNMALALKPNFAAAHHARRHCQSCLCDWSTLEQDVARLGEALEGADAQRSPAPFMLLGLHDDPALHKKAAENAAREYPPEKPLCAAPATTGPIRVGYFCAEFHDPATALPLTELCELHDRTRFEVHGYSFGPRDDGPTRCRLEASFDKVFDVSGQPAAEIAALARSQCLDIAVDLNGYSLAARPAIFAMRAAPLQVSYLGWPGTMGAEFIDYIIADDTVIPSSLRQHYSEAVAWLPDCYRIHDRKRPIAGRACDRLDAGLPAEGFVFCCFAESHKITPKVFDSWMRILHAVQGSVLWLLAANHDAAANLAREAASRGVAPERLVFAPAMQNHEHLARHRFADLFLDTSPAGAPTAVGDALRTGLPAVTRIGETFAGRAGASLLRAAGLSELIAQSYADYESLAVTIARDPQCLEDLRMKLAARMSTPLFDTPRTVRNLETAYAVMRDRSAQGLAPEDFRVAP